MIHCLSCKRYPTDAKVIPYGSDFPSDEFMVSLISKDLPNSMSISSADVVELPSGCKFAVGSKLHVVNGNDGSEVYVWNSEEFVLVESGSSVVTYTVTFMDNDGNNVLDTQSVKEGNDAIYGGTTPVNATDPSLSFLGWSTTTNSHNADVILTNIQGDMTVYAAFEEPKSDIKKYLNYTTDETNNTMTITGLNTSLIVSDQLEEIRVPDTIDGYHVILG